jgi:hypothetical protein
MKELLVQQDPILDGEFTNRVQEETQQAHPLESSAELFDVRRPGGSFV